jgi:hypothetical protein
MPTGPYTQQINPYGGSYTNSPDYMRRNYNMGSSGHSIEDRIIAQIEMLYDEMQGDHEHKVLDKWIARIRNDVA